MKTVSLEKRHLRHVAVRKLTTVNWIAGFLTFLFGAAVAPWAWAVIQWLIHQIPWWHVPGSFPDLLNFLAAPNLLFAFLWLGYYILAWVWATFTLSPRQKKEQDRRAYRDYRERHGGEWGLNTPSRDTNPWQPEESPYYYAQPDALKNATVPLSQAWPGELKHQLVEHCYAEYRKALKRFDPPPLVLKTPETFLYRQAPQIKWLSPATLVLPEAALTPERIHELLPLLAAALYDYNVEQITEETTHGFPDYVPQAPLLCITGNFLWVLVAYKHGTEAKTTTDSITQRKQRVLDRDEFAVLLGQGPALEHVLRMVQEDLKQRNESEQDVPTLSERIGRLSVLNEQERKEMRTLGLDPKEPPLVFDPTPPQIGKGKKPKQ